MSSRIIADPYCDWLYFFVGKPYGYSRLITALYDKPFKWFIPHDDNRAVEGLKLREIYCEEYRLPIERVRFNSEVSLLEVIIGLSIRCFLALEDNPDNVRVEDWFWILIRNTGLDLFDDENYLDNMVDLTMNKVINRTYTPSGRGGLFPLNGRHKDQRKVELWYQMSLYLVENYYNN
jgi:hypothetical protein